MSKINPQFLVPMVVEERSIRQAKCVPPNDCGNRQWICRVESSHYWSREEAMQYIAEALNFYSYIMTRRTIKTRRAPQKIALELLLKLEHNGNIPPGLNGQYLEAVRELSKNLEGGKNGKKIYRALRNIKRFRNYLLGLWKKGVGNFKTRWRRHIQV